MAESCEFSVDAPVSPVRVVAGETDDQLPEFGVDGWPSGFRGWWLGPVAGDETSMPPDDCLGPHDREHVGEASAVQHAGNQREDRAIRVGELSSVDLALQHQDLMSEGEDLGVAFVTGREEPPEPGRGESCEGSEQDHDGCTVPPPMWGRNTHKHSTDECPAPSRRGCTTAS